jgi:hypothetical protein
MTPSEPMAEKTNLREIAEKARYRTCERCHDAEIDDVNVEAWEETGLLLCPDCADAVFEEIANAD